MKNAAIIISLVLMTIMTFFIVEALHAREYRTVELSEAVDNALVAAMNNVALGKCYRIDNDDELVEDFKQLLMTSIDSASQIDVEVLKVDYEKGILEVNVTEHFKYINGRVGTISKKASAILDRQEYEDKYYTVRYYVDDNVYKSYVIAEGGTMIVPKAPQMEGYQFVGWQDISGNMQGDSGQMLFVENDVEWYASWKENW